VKRDLVIPDAAITYILFQRTAYLRFPIAPVYRLLNKLLPVPTPLYNLVVGLEARIGKARTQRLYAEDIYGEYRSFRAALPSTCTTVLDIGCGMAGIDVYLHRHYAPQPIQFYLLDKTQLEKKVWYLFTSQAAFYNSLPIAKQLLVSNGIPDPNIHLIEANPRNTIPVDVPVDVALSLLSWGFHYPVATYLQAVYELVSDRGIVILDVRNGTDGLDMLRQRFCQVDVLIATAKYQRVVARK
jgi:SAM-dependent methyltransferase